MLWYLFLRLKVSKNTKRGLNTMSNQEIYYHVIGTDGKHWYNLCYTECKKSALNYYLDNGWKKDQLKFIPMYRGGK